MNVLERFQQYAADFEKTYLDDNWSRLNPYFADDAAYVVRGMPLFPIDAKGRSNVLSALRRAVNGFDRRCDERKVDLLRPPEVEDRVVTIHWGGTYRLEGAPDLQISGVEVARYNDDGEIERLEDSYTEEVARRAEQWVEAHLPNAP